MPPTPPDRTVPRRQRSFLLAKDDTILVPASLGDLDLDFVVEQLDADPSVTIESDLRPRNFRAQSLGTSITDRVVVATMSDETAAELTRHPQVVLEEDSLLVPQPGVGPVVEVDPGLLSPFGTATSWTIVLTGVDERPVADATVYLYGSGVPAQGRTDATGSVTLHLVGESDATLRALYINPLSAYWSAWIDRPALVSGASTTISLQPLAESFPGFPGTELLGWGQQAMRLDQIPAGLTGEGVTIAVVDSGAAALTHPDLADIHDGIDLTTTPADTGKWWEDTIAHGSHCSGVIAGARNAQGVRGFAPEANVHEARIFPGGRISSLLDAVDYCIDQGIDLVNMSLGTGGSSQILLQKLAQAKELGVACVVAAGNTGGAVQFPGTSPDVLTVAAIGQNHTFPEDSYHAQQRWKAGVADGDYFSAQFSCHGDEVDVCGPGVAIVSSVPSQDFAAWDGTSMATPHVTGLCALVLAHHPDFQSGPFAIRGSGRVDRLFELVRSAATPLQFGDPGRSGAGLPDVLRAIGLEGSPATGDTGPARTLAVTAALAQLRQELVSAGLVAELMNLDPLPALRLDRHLTEVSIRRDLAELKVRMSNAGLDVAVAAP